MKLFSNTRAKRNTALMVLLVWLFALASGVANACLLEARGTHSHAATAGSAGTTHAPAIVPGHAGAIADHDDDSHTLRAPCLKACDDGLHSFPKQDLTVAQTDPGPAPLVAVLWTAATPVVSSFRRMDDRQQPVTPELPIRVRYSRLAL
ncbi:hypothetical protein [Polaromonas sp.]|uniref:hypothetical protein n=1 Tax=Polaromonas sp. TaxID=1869339 RepID=UPI00286CFB19|nr:hypothetical protein [Polaromonas sp.]